MSYGGYGSGIEVEGESVNIVDTVSSVADKLKRVRPGEYKLAAQTIVQALVDAVQTKDDYLKSDARSWIRYDCDLRTFRWCCEVLELNEIYFRNKLLEILEDADRNGPENLRSILPGRKRSIT